MSVRAARKGHERQRQAAAVSGCRLERVIALCATTNLRKRSPLPSIDDFDWSDTPVQARRKPASHCWA